MLAALRNHALFIALITVVTAVHLYKLGTGELLSDNALYAIRSLGWVDYFGPLSGQFGPLEWLGNTPWWSFLSFQDAPPLALFLQHVSFSLLGEGSFAAHLPSSLCGIVTAMVLYLGLYRLKGKRTALWGTFAFSVSSLALWSARNAYLEGVEVLWMTSAFLLLALYLVEKRAVFLYGGAFTLALAFLTKYTVLFMVPAFCCALLFDSTAHATFTRVKEDALKLLIALGIFLATLTPVIIYNCALIFLRGRVDTALARMLGSQNEVSGSPSPHFLANLLSIGQGLWSTSSLPFLLLAVLGMGCCIIRVYRKKNDAFELYLTATLVLLFVQLGVMGGEVRWLPLLIPFFACAIGVLLAHSSKHLVLHCLAFVVLGAEAFYALNTHLLSSPLGIAGITYSSVHERSVGFAALDTSLQRHVGPLTRAPHPRLGVDLERLRTRAFLASAPAVILYDGRINWFASRWYFERYPVYYGVAALSLAEPFRHDVLPVLTLSSIQALHTRGAVYVVVPLSTAVESSEAVDDPATDALVAELIAAGYHQEIITTTMGTPAFGVYRIPPEGE